LLAWHLRSGVRPREPRTSDRASNPPHNRLKPLTETVFDGTAGTGLTVTMELGEDVGVVIPAESGTCPAEPASKIGGSERLYRCDRSLPARMCRTLCRPSSRR